MVLDLGVSEFAARKNWPNLRAENMEDNKSPKDIGYNCIAWAVRETKRWWEPGNPDLVYWPKGVAPIWTVDGIAAALATRGYVVCADETVQAGFEKIALYGKGADFTHVARQLSDGQWTSKLGILKDIIHRMLDDLNGNFYGTPILFMQRPRARRRRHQRRQVKR